MKFKLSSVTETGNIHHYGHIHDMCCEVDHDLLCIVERDKDMLSPLLTSHHILAVSKS